MIGMFFGLAVSSAGLVLLVFLDAAMAIDEMNWLRVEAGLLYWDEPELW